MELLSWAGAHSQTINIVINALMLVIWAVYLHTFLISFRRQRRSVLHIDLGAARDKHARCIVTNMGSETIYIAAIVIDLCIDDDWQRHVVTERKEMAEDRASRPLERTTKGPLGGGEAVDVGSFRDLVSRIEPQDAAEDAMRRFTAITVTAVAVSNQAKTLTAGLKRFDVERGGDGWVFTPEMILTRQMRKRWSQRMRVADIAN